MKYILTADERQTLANHLSALPYSQAQPLIAMLSKLETIEGEEEEPKKEEKVDKKK